MRLRDRVIKTLDDGSIKIVLHVANESKDNRHRKALLPMNELITGIAEKRQQFFSEHGHPRLPNNSANAKRLMEVDERNIICGITNITCHLIPIDGVDTLITTGVVKPVANKTDMFNLAMDNVDPGYTFGLRAVGNYRNDSGGVQTYPSILDVEQIITWDLIRADESHDAVAPLFPKVMDIINSK